MYFMCISVYAHNAHKPSTNGINIQTAPKMVFCIGNGIFWPNFAFSVQNRTPNCIKYTAAICGSCDKYQL